MLISVFPLSLLIRVSNRLPATNISFAQENPTKPSLAPKAHTVCILLFSFRTDTLLYGSPPSRILDVALIFKGVNAIRPNVSQIDNKPSHLYGAKSRCVSATFTKFDERYHLILSATFEFHALHIHTMDWRERQKMYQK